MEGLSWVVGREVRILGNCGVHGGKCVLIILWITRKQRSIYNSVLEFGGIDNDVMYQLSGILREYALIVK